MTYAIQANALMQRWVTDATAFPRAVPARLRGILAAGLEHHDGGSYLSATFTPLDLPVPALEKFTNLVRLDTLKPVQRLTPGSDFWVYECVAIGIALGEAVLTLDPEVTVFVTVDVDDVEYPDAQFWFGRQAVASVDERQAALTMTAGR